MAKTFAEKYVEGQISQLWYSFEIISLGGKVSFIIRVPERMRHNAEAAVYSQYPTAEIAEVEDYMRHFKYDPEKTPDVDLFGTEWKMDQSYVIPIKTYKDFEHPAAEEKILDPLSHLFESLAKMEPHEFFGVQILCMPLADEEWKPKSELKVKELTGEEVPHKASIIRFLLKPLEAFANFSYKETFFGAKHTHPEQQNKPKTNWLNMTEGEKLRVTLIENKANKPGYLTKIRFLYIAPKDRFDKSKAFMTIGAYRPFSAPFYNKIKPDIHTTWTHVDYRISPTLEKPWLDMRLKYKKRMIFKGYRARDWDIGSPLYVLNTEELATLYHFPITTETTSAPTYIERTETKKSQPPANLPVIEN